MNKEELYSAVEALIQNNNGDYEAAKSIVDYLLPKITANANGQPTEPQLKPLKGYWVCVDKHDKPVYYTLSRSEISSSVKLTENVPWSQTAGYRCEQVDITFAETKK